MNSHGVSGEAALFLSEADTEKVRDIIDAEFVEIDGVRTRLRPVRTIPSQDELAEARLAGPVREFSKYADDFIARHRANLGHAAVGSVDPSDHDLH